MPYVAQMWLILMMPASWHSRSGAPRIRGGDLRFCFLDSTGHVGNKLFGFRCCCEAAFLGLGFLLLRGCRSAGFLALL
jgi:hypothetical protein